MCDIPILCRSTCSINSKIHVTCTVKPYLGVIYVLSAVTLLNGAVVRTSSMYASYGISNLEAIIRKQTFGFSGRLSKSCNTNVQTFENAWIIRIH